MAHTSNLNSSSQGSGFDKSQVFCCVTNTKTKEKLLLIMLKNNTAALQREKNVCLQYRLIFLGLTNDRITVVLSVLHNFKIIVCDYIRACYCSLGFRKRKINAAQMAVI